MEASDFAAELSTILPADLPLRDVVIEKSSQHLQMILAVNEYMNLTRITSVRDAAVKHVLDSVLPWKLFADARSVMDAGTGAGLPGIPLAILLPQTRFLLVESVQKKARFVESVVEALGLTNVEVSSKRAEDLLQTRKVDLITARAVAPLDRAIGYFAAAFKHGSKALLFKGPDVETEMAEAAMEARKRKVAMKVVMGYELPDALGSRTIIRLEAKV